MRRSGDRAARRETEARPASGCRREYSRRHSAPRSGAQHSLGPSACPAIANIPARTSPTNAHFRSPMPRWVFGLGRDGEFADSPLEESGFELLVPLTPKNESDAGERDEQVAMPPLRRIG